jgi:hypothetical protein
MRQGFKPLPDYWYNALIDATAQYLPTLNIALDRPQYKSYNPNRLP